MAQQFQTMQDAVVGLRERHHPDDLVAIIDVERKAVVIYEANQEGAPYGVELAWVPLAWVPMENLS